MNTNSFASRTQRYQLDNGIQLLVLENHGNPTVSLYGYLWAGEYFNPQGKDALAGITASMLGKGTTRRSKLEIAESMESRGARAGFSSNMFTTSLSGLSLSKDFPLIVSTLAEELRMPAFPLDELDKMRQRMIASIREDQDETRVRAYERLTQILYPAGNPFHKAPADQLISEIESITIDDIRAFYETYYGTESMLITVVGDIVPDDVLKLIEQNLGDWQGASPSTIDLPVTPLQSGPMRETISLKDKPNCDIVLGHASQLRRSNPDFIPAIIANRALGHSTLSSRLGMKVRDEMGLTYGITSGFSGSGIGDGPFTISVTVAPENIDLAIDTTIEITNDYIAEGITETELADEKSSMSGSFKLSLATNGGMAGRIADSVLFGLGIGYLDEYPSIIAAITKDEVDEAIRKYIHPDVATTVIAGTFE